MEQKQQSFVMENRKKLVLTGVREVCAFTENEISLYTVLGELTIKGKNLRIEKASVENGDLEVYGELINSAVFSEKFEKVPKNFITKLFK